jgi:hypothetical protein
LTFALADNYIASYSQIGSRKRAETKDIESPDNRVYSYKRAIDEEETKYLIYYSDLTYVVPKPDSLMRRNFGSLAPQIKMKRFRASIDQEKQDGDENIKIWKEEKVEKFFTRTILIIGLLMLVGPLWALEFVLVLLKRLGVVTGFIVLLLILVSGVIMAGSIKSLAGTAG